MYNTIFKYLSAKQLAVPYLVNSLLVSAYVYVKGWHVENCSVIRNLLGYKQEDIVNFIKVLKKNGFGFTLEELIRLFEFVISPSDRIVTGAVYTPADVRMKIIRECMKQCNHIENARVADISCGCGGFLMDVALLLNRKTGKSFTDIYRENIFGIDIQGYSVERTKIILSLLALEHQEDTDFDFNILEADTLDFQSEEWNQQYLNFNVIVGNPPYVCSRNVSEKTREKMLQYKVCGTGHPDLYIPFFQIASEMLDEHGILGYITMNSFLRLVNGRAVRDYFSDNSLNIKIMDFRGFQIFQSKSTYTCLFYLKKGVKSKNVQYMVNEEGDLGRRDDYARVAYGDLDNIKGWSLNDHICMQQLESVGTPIGKYCGSRHGIATLSNRVYIFRPECMENGRFWMTKDGERLEIETDICRDVVNSNKLNSEVCFDDIIEKVIFPYRFDENGKACVIDEQTMRTDYPYAYDYLSKNKTLLATRDKGKTDKYPIWYAFGRTQSLRMPRYKLFFPKFANKPIRCVLKDDEALLLYNGLAFVSDDDRRLQIVKRIMESQLFWKYIVKNSKPYASGYYSLSGVDIKNFGVPEFTQEEEDELIGLEDKDEIEVFLQRYYRLEK